MKYLRLLGLVCGLLITFSSQVNAASGLRLYFDNSNFSLSIGEKKTFHLMIDSGAESVSAADLSISYGNKIKVNSVVMSTTNFGIVMASTGAGGNIKLTGLNSKPVAQLPKGQFEIASVEIEGVASGTVDFNLVSSQIVGVTAATRPFSSILTKPTVIVGSNNPVPTEIMGNGSDGILKFKVVFSGVVSGAECANNWPLKVLVMEKNGSSQTYSNIPIVSSGETSDGKMVYDGEVLLSGITTKENLSVFVKGPKHLQTKYGVDLQESFYNQPGGNISVTNNSDSTPVYDFTNYPMLAGDINQDGSVDAVDFSEVKAAVAMRSTGDDLASDLNGNCQLESQDLAQLMLAMKERQEQTY